MGNQLACSQCCDSADNIMNVETEDKIIKEVLGYEGDDTLGEKGEEVTIFTPRDGIDPMEPSPIAKTTFLPGIPEHEQRTKRSIELHSEVPCLNFDRLKNNKPEGVVQHGGTDASPREGTPTSSTRGTRPGSSTSSFISPRVTPRLEVDSSHMKLPISSYALGPGQPDRPLSKHIAFAPSREHSVHQSEHSVTPYSELYGQHPRSFHFDSAGNMVACEEQDFDEENIEKCILQRREEFAMLHAQAAPGAVCYDD